MWSIEPLQSRTVHFFFSSFELEDENVNYHDCEPDRDPLKGDDIRINGESLGQMWHVFGWTFRGCASGCGTAAKTSKFLGVVFLVVA